ncbi:DNA-binding NarL/FixJ family response regulator [Mucilaginibacter sp. SG538B]|uniref:AAA family ATPase n=1 Tax=Mucilaginibacter sp. SG538B TaxID=2587021 RepID=UPI00159E3039|nr:AAA family ATPase [Mucilaginibacter sp. SG538B]NVM61927.1 DNA-binding NarL/FixJ family response regulator [Mucilaginibacter sp. SG538B]
MIQKNGRPLVVEMIRADVREAARRDAKRGIRPRVYDPDAIIPDAFIIHQASTWMAMERERQTPRMLFGEFWLEGELCILFADTNMGKSLLAVQLGDSITRGKAITPFKMDAEPCPVLYIDFELTGKQFEQRYTDGSATHTFHENFYRGEFDQMTGLPQDFKTFDEFITHALSRAIKRTDARVLIIDNITCLRNGTERSSQALSLMKQLKLLKTRHGLSILVLAHTPKRNPSLPITRNDLQGSKMLINFADSAFAMAESQTLPGYRYLKQVKQRSTAEMYGSHNVCLGRLERQNGFLQFVFSHTDNEVKHLRRYSQVERQRRAADVLSLHKQGLSQRQIAGRLEMSLSAVNRVLGVAGG